MPKPTAFLRCLIFPIEKILQNKFGYISMCFLSSTAGSQMKCDVDFNLLCIKHTEQTSVLLMLGTAPSENCFQGRLRVCICLVSCLLCLSSGSKTSSLLLLSVPESNSIVTEGSGSREPPKAQGFFWSALKLIPQPLPIHSIGISQISAWRVSWLLFLPQMLLRAPLELLGIYWNPAGPVHARITPGHI